MEWILKNCKGFKNENCCSLCIRQDNNCKVRLVGKLFIDPNDGRKYCKNFIDTFKH